MRIPIVGFFALLLPLAEIAIFIVVARQISVLATLGLVLLAMIAGIMLLRNHGLSAFRRVALAINKHQSPQKPLLDGFMLMLTGILLIVPGFITDLIALLLWVPFIRYRLWRLMGEPLTARYFWQGQGDFVDLEDDDFHSPDDEAQKRLGDRAKGL